MLQAGETALYSEFAFEGAVIAQNIVDGAQTGVSVTNFNEGGRLAVVQGNILRNLKPKDLNPPPEDLWGIGVYVEADTTVSANVVENARDAGIAVGGAPGVDRHRRGSALISANVVTGFRRGAVVGMDHARPITGELAKDGAQPHAHLSITGNRIG